jgi:hypothetical protein
MFKVVDNQVRLNKPRPPCIADNHTAAGSREQSTLRHGRCRIEEHVLRIVVESLSKVSLAPMEERGRTSVKSSNN